MRHLKNFKLFLEDADFDVNLTDAPDLRMSKEKFNTIKKYLNDYNLKKKLIDQAYLTVKIDVELQKKIEQILGPTDAKPGDDRNPFLVEYLHISSLKRQMDKLQKELVNDKISKDDFQEQLKLSTEASTKDSVNKKLAEINTRMSTKTTTISSLSRDVADSEKKLQEKMSKIQKEMNDYIQKISKDTPIQ